MIEVVTCPPDLGTWDPNGELPYLELFGETHPRLCTLPPLVVPGDSSDHPQNVGAAPIYEYFWTLGVSEPTISHWQHDPEIGAVVELYFPRSGGWRACEAVAAIHMLRPLPHEERLIEKVAEYWKTVSPIVEDVGALLKIVPTPISPAASTLVSVLARMHITALPPIDGFAWSVSKTTHKVDAELMDGIRWRVPKTIFKTLGNRLSGSIAVYFVPTHPQQDRVLVSYPGELSEMAILGRARILGDRGDLVSSPCDAIKLRVRPCSTSEPAATHQELHTDLGGSTSS